MSVVELPKPAPDAGLVQMLEDVLAAAKRGEIVSLAIASEMTGGRVATSFHRTSLTSVFQLLGAVRCVEARVLREVEVDP